ncbi:MAG: type II secretion system GspH family protein [Sulfuritalea sp.]|nr:type II secretion system GspH family protein [Sulfuritalea sp.]
MCTNRQSGLTLIELIVFIVIVSVALVGVLTVLNVTAKSSADPVIRKQALAVAEAVLEEVMLQPFTWCDPNDRSAATAKSATLDGSATDPAQCWDAVEAVGKETISGNTDTRGSTTFPLDNVSDYDTESINTGAGGSGMPSGYSATVSVAQSGLNGIAATESLLVTVTVSGPGDDIQLQGYRTRHSPNMLP